MQKLVRQGQCLGAWVSGDRFGSAWKKNYGIIVVIVMTVITGWWFGCHLAYFPRNIGLLIIPMDFHIFQRGGPTTNQNKYWKNNDAIIIPHHYE